MKRWLQTYSEKLRASSNDLTLYWYFHLFFVLAAVVTAKARAVHFAYGKMEMGAYLVTLLHVLPFDLLFVSTLAVSILVARKFPAPPPRIRWVLLFLAPILSLLCVFFAHLNFGFYAQMGHPLSADILALAPHMFMYLLPSVNVEGVVALIGILLSFIMLVAWTPLLAAATRHHFIRDIGWTLRPWIYTAILTILGLLLLTRPALGIREVTLREMTLPSIFSSPDDVSEPYQLDSKRHAELLQMCGPVDTAGKEEFAALTRRPYNVVIWVLESTGIRYIKSMHPLGQALTPNMDKAIANGAVGFDNFYCESPLSVQSGWAILTGTPPPAFPSKYVDNRLIPAHEPQITTELKERNYNTAVIIGGPTPIWGLDKIAKAGKVDLFEDMDSLHAAGFKAEGWSVEGSAINTAFLRFVDSKPGESFFGLLWQVESHSPYHWIGDSPEDRALKDSERYIRSIEHVDRLFGNLYSELEKRKLLNDTIIIIVGDHGEGTGRGPRPFDQGHSSHVYEDAIHVPLFFLNPVLKGSKKSVSAVCSHIDLAPTLMDLCGFPINPRLPGVSLAQPIQPRPFFARSKRVWPMSVRAGNLKMLLPSALGTPELYDVKKDIQEEHDLAGKDKNITELLAAAIRENASKMLPSPGK